MHPFTSNFSPVIIYRHLFTSISFASIFLPASFYQYLFYQFSFRRYFFSGIHLPVSFNHEYRGGALVFMSHDNVFAAGHPHQDTDEFSIVDIEARHVDVGMPFAVAPGEVYVVGEILLPLTDIFLSIEICCRRLPLILSKLASRRIDALGGIGVHGF